jgi:predicted transcriptional regulator
MPASETLTIRLPAATKKRLGELAARTRRTKSFLAGEAISAYLARETAIVAGIERGIEDMKKNRTVPHAEAMTRLRATAAAKRRSK